MNRITEEPANRLAGSLRIPLCVPEIKGNEWLYVRECLDTNWVSSAGPFVDRFENMLARRTGAKHAVATVNGTSALHVALLAAGIEPNDEVLVSTLTFIAPANAIRYAGAWPVLVDADPETWQMDVARIRNFVEQDCNWREGRLINVRTNRQVRAILPVHILGHPVDMDGLLAIARKYNLLVIEDATESLGATYRGAPVGCLGDIGCFSFNGNKIITTGGGGMAVTGHQPWAARMRHLTTQAKDHPVEYMHSEVGFNYRLTNIQAAIGCAQMEKLDEYVAAKRSIARHYESELAGVPGISPMPEAKWAFSTYWLYTLLVDPEIYGMDSRALLEALARIGVQTRPLWQPLHLGKAHGASRALGGATAENLNRKALSLPSSVGLSTESVDRICQLIRTNYKGVSRGQR